MRTQWTQRLSIVSLALVVPGMALSQTTEAPAAAWRHLSMDDVQPALDVFRPMRARYLQLIYDLEGEERVEGGSYVQIDVDRAIHSGGWDRRIPVTIDPIREPGLVVTWQIQNALYRAFDRVLTDSRLSLKQRVMPSGFLGLRVGFMEGDEHVRIDAAPPAGDESIPVRRTPLPNGSVNVLTLPYVLASLELKPGERFTLPGYALIGGPGGVGTPWLAAIWVRSVRQATIRGQAMGVKEVFSMRLDDLEVTEPDFSIPGKRVTRLMVSDRPPYLLGRADLTLTEEGEYRFVREFLGLVDWAELPLPVSMNGAIELWDLSLETGEMTLEEDRRPEVLLPLHPSENPIGGGG